MATRARRRVTPGKWTKYLPGIDQKVIFRGHGTTVALYRLGPGVRSPLHRHREAQLGICVTGAGLHRIILRVRRGRGTRGEMTDITVQAGDAYYIPPAVPHEFVADSKHGAMILDLVMHRLTGEVPF